MAQRLSKGQRSALLAALGLVLLQSWSTGPEPRLAAGSFCAPGVRGGGAAALQRTSPGPAAGCPPTGAGSGIAGLGTATRTTQHLPGLLCAAAVVLVGVARAGRVSRGATTVETTDLQELLKTYKRQIEDLRGACKDVLTDQDDTTLLRFILEHPQDTTAAIASFREVVAWRQGEGAAMVDSAKKAVEAAMKDGGWNNDAVLGAAPNSDKVSKYLTPSNIVVVSTKEGDLVSCIRAAAIDSPKMMDAVTVEELVAFFLYSREVNFIVADMRTRKSGRLTRLVAANDLTGVSSFPDSRFQTALTESSKKAAKLYPGFTGPTVLLNLPWLARALVSLLTPLFPGAVREKIKFARTPMDYMKNLKDITTEPVKSMFVDDLGAVLRS